MQTFTVSAFKGLQTRFPNWLLLPEETVSFLLTKLFCQPNPISMQRIACFNRLLKHFMPVIVLISSNLYSFVAPFDSQSQFKYY